jgi:hypothetical protein
VLFAERRSCKVEGATATENVHAHIVFDSHALILHLSRS